MIQKLSVKNFALIDNSEIEFYKGLNVLSGETGSGKSILLDAINFALGAKADKSFIRFGTAECVVSCEFSIESKEVENVLKEFDIEFDDNIIIKRKYTIDGKSSIKVNGETVTAGMLKKITSNLVDVHGQSDHYFLLDNKNQLLVLDSFCGDELVNLKEKLIEPISRIKELKKLLTKLLSTEGGDRKIDILKYQIKEIESADLKEGEEEELQEKRKIFVNAEKIIKALSKAYSLISDDNGASDLFMQSCKELGNISAVSDKFSEISDVAENILSQIDEMSSQIQNELEGMDFSVEDADLVEKRLETIKEIKRKYGNSVQEVYEFLDTCKKELNDILNSAELIEEYNKEINNLNVTISNIYNDITNLRQKNSRLLCERVTESLKTLSMKSAEFSINFSKNEELLSLDGQDVIEFMFSANKGEPLKSMSKVISGGEMSRFMLSLKTVISSAHQIPTYIFDEIDAGISGNVANTVAQKLFEISKNKQIIAISHLPQITAMSDTSYLITKFEVEDKTCSSVQVLDDNGKVNEIVRLIGGVESDSARLHAIELIDNAKNFKKNS